MSLLSFAEELMVLNFPSRKISHHKHFSEGDKNRRPLRDNGKFP